jgi:hypothetical protein
LRFVGGDVFGAIRRTHAEVGDCLLEREEDVSAKKGSADYPSGGGGVEYLDGKLGGGGGDVEHVHGWGDETIRTKECRSQEEVGPRAGGRGEA